MPRSRDPIPQRFVSPLITFLDLHSLLLITLLPCPAGLAASPATPSPDVICSASGALGLNSRTLGKVGQAIPRSRETLTLLAWRGVENEMLLTSPIQAVLFPWQTGPISMPTKGLTLAQATLLNNAFRHPIIWRDHFANTVHEKHHHASKGY